MQKNHSRFWNLLTSGANLLLRNEVLKNGQRLAFFIALKRGLYELYISAGLFCGFYCLVHLNFRPRKRAKQVPPGGH